jgi:hypothetical protein
MSHSGEPSLPSPRPDPPLAVLPARCSKGALQAMGFLTRFSQHRLDKRYSLEKERGSYFKDVLQEQSWLNTDQLPTHHFMRQTDVRHKPPKKAKPDLSGMLDDKRLRKRIKVRVRACVDSIVR